MKQILTLMSIANIFSHNSKEKKLKRIGSYRLTGWSEQQNIRWDNCHRETFT
jgi:hypothetical protein